MAKQGKPKANGAAADEHELVTMARGLAEIVAAHNLSELVVDTKETTLTIRRGGVAMAMPAMSMAMPAMPSMPAMAAMASSPAMASAPAPMAAAVDDKSHVVTSPFVGTFYRKPNPDSPVYVALNDKVDKGQVLCIVEAMKLMNEIEAEHDGTVVACLVENAQPVEYGQQLFKITP